MLSVSHTEEEINATSQERPISATMKIGRKHVKILVYSGASSSVKYLPKGTADSNDEKASHTFKMNFKVNHAIGRW